MNNQKSQLGLNSSLARRRFLQFSGAGLLAGTGAGLVSAPGQAAVNDQPDWADKYPALKEYPSLSLRERDRRWALVREMMRKHDVQSLFVPMGDVHRMSPNGYFSNDVPAHILFPLEGDPIVVGEAALFSGAIMHDEMHGNESWIKDWRYVGGRGIPAIIKELGWNKGRIGTIGVSDGTILTMGGDVMYDFWKGMTEALPDVTWVELWDAFAQVWLPKSEEELACFRKGAVLTEAGADAAALATRPGKTVADMQASVYDVTFRHGGRLANIFMGGGFKNAYWGTARYLNRAQKPREFQEGEVWCYEFGAFCGHLEAWINMTVAIGKVDPIFHKLAAVARESYEIGLETLKPGVTLREVHNAMDAPTKRAGYWHLTPYLYTMNPLQNVGPGVERLEQYPEWKKRFPTVHNNLNGFNMDIPLEPGMVFSIQPNASSGPYRANIGGNAILTETGAIGLNEVPCRMITVDL